MIRNNQNDLFIYILFFFHASDQDGISGIRFTLSCEMTAKGQNSWNYDFQDTGLPKMMNSDT